MTVLSSIKADERCPASSPQTLSTALGEVQIPSVVVVEVLELVDVDVVVVLVDVVVLVEVDVVVVVEVLVDVLVVVVVDVEVEVLVVVEVEVVVLVVVLVLVEVVVVVDVLVVVVEVDVLVLVDVVVVVLVVVIVVVVEVDVVQYSSTMSSITYPLTKASISCPRSQPSPEAVSMLLSLMYRPALSVQSISFQAFGFAMPKSPATASPQVTASWLTWAAILQRQSSTAPT